MKWVVLGVAALGAASAGVCQPAEALPVGPPRDATAVAQSGPLLPVRSSWHHRRYRDRAQATGAATPGPAGSAAVRPGLWEYTEQLQTAATPTLPEAPQPPRETAVQVGGATYSHCIVSDSTVPTAFGSQCRIDDVQRSGPKISWSMTCTNPRSSVRSEGVAHYHGDTMEGMVISHLPVAGGKMMDVTQRIAGRYLGPCTRTAEGPMPPSPPNASPNPPSGGSAHWVDPPGAKERAEQSATIAMAPSGAAGETAETALPNRPAPRVRRYNGIRRHRYHHYYSQGAWPWGGGLLQLPFIGRVF